MRDLINRLRENNISLILQENDLKIRFDGADLPEYLLNEIKANKSELIEYLKIRIGDSKENLIPKISAQPSYPLSSSQLRLWILSKFEGGNWAYNIPVVYEFTGDLEVDVLERSFVKLIERHESLRTVFGEGADGHPEQIIRPASESGFKLHREDVRDFAEGESYVREEVQKEFSKSFELSRGPMLRAGIYQLEDHRWIFSYVMHHIISDGLSMENLVRELMQLYNSGVRGASAELPELRIQYKDYAVWQQSQLKGGKLSESKSYWLKQYEGDIPVVNLHGDYPRPSVKSYNGGRVSRSLERSSVKDFKQMIKTNGSTVFMGLLSLVKTLLYKYTNQQDIIIGTPIAGREQSDLIDQIGFYANTLALRTRFNSNESYLDLLSKVKEVTLGAYEHQMYPFDELIENLNLERDLSRNPLFDIQVILINSGTAASGSGHDLSGLKIKPYNEIEQSGSRFELIFNFIDSSEDLNLVIEYNSDIYKKETIARLGEHLNKLLSSIVSSPSSPLRDHEYLNSEEKQRLLYEYNATKRQRVRGKTIMDLFSERARSVPDGIAVEYQDIKLSYKELEEKTNQLANHLINNYGIKANDRVAIMVDRSEKLILSILSVLKSGAAYVPIDTDYPSSRKAYIIKDTALKVLITQTDYVFDLDYYQGAVFAIDAQLDNLQESSMASPALIQNDDTAYIIYTSGSTGQPKGAMIKHHSLTNLVEWYSNLLRINESDNVLLMAPISFDLAQKNIFAPLISGARLCVAPKLYANYQSLVDIIEDKKVSVVNSAPSAFYPLLNPSLNLDYKKLSSIKKVILGGEIINKREFISWINSPKCKAEIINSYGPTECTDVVSYHRLNEQDWQSNDPVPIGQPIDNTRLYILNEDHSLVAEGMQGEIYISGDCLGKGYLNNAALSSEKFIADPFYKGELMYRTGDLGRWTDRGQIEFIGRKDNQVKIRGYRIELAEIESVLHQYKQVESAVVMVKKDTYNNNELIAYLVANTELNLSDLRNYLSLHLPEYMMPSHYVELKQMPLNANGKIDRRRLMELESGELTLSTEYVAPRNEIETKLVEIWQEVLEKQKIGINDNFFELGGHSLKIAVVMHRIETTFNVKLKMNEIFNNPTISFFADMITANQWIESSKQTESVNRNIVEL